MPLFNSDAERQRKENLKLLEDRRIRLAENLNQQGFRPERMLFCSREDGSFVALARHEGRFALIDSPRFGEEADFMVDIQDVPRYEREEVFEKGSGLNGVFGFGTKGCRGFNLFIITSEGMHVKVPVIYGRNCWLEVPYKKNPLLSLKRRRGNANVAWDLSPINNNDLDKIERMLFEYYLK